MIIFTDTKQFWPFKDEFTHEAYGIATLADVEGYEKDGGPIEMLSEWGWYGPTDKKPNWYIDSGPWNRPDENES